MGEIDKLVENIKRQSGRAAQAQIRFVECRSVDWEQKTMTAKGMADDADYLDISLGLGAVYVRPAKGSTCLIGIIDGLEVANFLIGAEVVELADIKADSIIFNDGDNQGQVNIKPLTSVINDIQKDLNALKQVFATWTPFPSDGGAALKTAALQWTGQAITMTQQSDIEDTKIKH